MNFLTVEDVAQKLAIKPRTVWGLIRSGKLEAVKIGRVYRIEQASFERFIQKHLV